MSYASSTIRCVEYLFEKHKSMFEHVPVGTKVIGTPQQRTPYTAKEHDEIYRTIKQHPSMNNAQLSRKLGIPRTTVSTIRRKKHPQYDPVRSER